MTEPMYFNSSAVRVPSIGIQTIESKVELRFAIQVPARKKTWIDAVYIYHTRHDFDACFASIHHICVLQGPDSFPSTKWKKRRQIIKRSPFIYFYL